MSNYKKTGNITVNGKIKTVFQKEGSAKNYVSYKGRKMGLVKYKKMEAKKLILKRGGSNMLEKLMSKFQEMKMNQDGGKKTKKEAEKRAKKRADKKRADKKVKKSFM